MVQATQLPTDAHQTRIAHRVHRPTKPEPVSYTIAEALAAAENVPVTELEVCLAEYVDVDALNALFERSSAADNLALSFTVETYTVHVEGTGHISVSETQ